MLCCLTNSAERDFVPWPPSIEATCWCGLVASLLLVVAMAAPYWLVSWEDTESPFLRMGPWEACFYRWGPVSDVSTVGSGESSSSRVVGLLLDSTNWFGKFPIPISVLGFEFDNSYSDS